MSQKCFVNGVYLLFKRKDIYTIICATRNQSEWHIWDFPCRDCWYDLQSNVAEEGFSEVYLKVHYVYV